MKRRGIYLTGIISVAAVVGIANASYAGYFGDHPKYLHALSDMRYARELIQRPDARNVVEDERAATGELDAAIHEVMEAAKEDWKPTMDHPPVDSSMDRPGRFHEALKVLDKAQGDLSKEEDNPSARGLRNRAIKHIEAARDLINKAISDKEFDKHR
ncbi:MAG TPA: hypothetical protein V6C69_07730 [Trichormus sp.]